MQEILIYLGTVEEPRKEWKAVHALKDIVALVLLGLLANADDWQQIELFGRANEELLREYFPLQNGIPSHDTLQRVMSMVKPETLAHFKRYGIACWTAMKERS